MKSSKMKQKLYNRFLKNKTYQNETTYKNYRKLFETIKTKAKKNFYSKIPLKYKNDMKNTWKFIKEVIGKKKIGHDLPKHMVINGINTFDEETIAISFNNYFVNVGPKLASKFQCTDKKFEDLLTKSITTLQEKHLSDNELKDTFYSLKINKISGYDDINYDAIRNAFGSLIKLLKHVFNLSLTKGIFPDQLKMVRVTPIFKAGEMFELGN